MKVEIKVPAMGESIAEAIVGEIIKPSGSFVNMDDVILELETDKVNQELYAAQSGLIELFVKSEESVTIGQVIGVIDTEKEASGVETEKGESAPAKSAEPAREQAPPPSSPPSRITKEHYVSQLATPVETKAAANSPTSQSQPLPSSIPPNSAPSAPASSEKKALPSQREGRKRMSRLRQVISKKLVEVQQQTAMLTTFNEVDMTEVMALRNKYRDKFAGDHGVKLGFMSFFIKASVSALKAFPDVNAYIDGDEIVYRHYYDISVAVSTEKGLIVPVVRECDKLSFAEVESAIGATAKKAREGSLTLDDLKGGGFTITNGGIYGSLLSTPIINPPQSAILGMHAIQKRAVVVGDEIVIRPMMYLALSYDHRIIDGKEAVSFLVHIKNGLEDPSRLLIDV